MSTAVATVAAAVPALAMSEEELCSVLQSSLYPGAALPSIKLAISYCRAAGLDPMQKPVHLVPMRVKKPGGGRDDYEWRDVVMPGIGLYRVQAARSGCYAGVSEPEFGPTRVLEAGEFRLEYPEWCKVTVRRFNEATGQIFDFTATEYWLENYATKGRDSKVPNEMWQRRPRGQIAKCAEAQALRKAFPEVGSAPTADEMEGRVEFEGTESPGAVAGPTVKAPASKSAAAKARAVEDAVVVPPAGEAPEASADDPPVGDGELAFLRKKAEATGRDLDALAAEKSIDLAALKKSGFAALKVELGRAI